MMIRCGWISLVLGLPLCFAGHLVAQGITVELELDGQMIQGTPLDWSNRNVTLLRRDGYLLNFHPSKAKSFHKVSDFFQSYSQSDLRTQLAFEFGRGFDVSGTGNYLVVHPRGQRDKWAARFEQLYRSFVHYFAARGFRPQRLQFPLIAVVFPSERDFQRYASQTGARLIRGTLGYYSNQTNRILLYDVTAGANEDDRLWHVNADTIIHEAAHQTAFNTGIHSRYALPPRWVAEGLGTMFEAPGVWDSRNHPQQRDRINKGRMLAFKRYTLSRRKKGSLPEFVSTDRMFHADPEGAYAEAWALTFFLAETRPRQYMQYLARTASVEKFTVYRSPDRLRDFIAIFGSDFEMLESHYLRFINGLN